jgi:excisionase family DNA binding protein
MGTKRHKPVKYIPKGYVDVEEAARITGYSRSGVYNLIHSRRVTSVRFGRYRYIRASDLKQIKPLLHARRLPPEKGTPQYHWGSRLTEAESVLLKQTAEALRISYSEAMRQGLYLLAWSVARRSGKVPHTADLDPSILSALVEMGEGAHQQVPDRDDVGSPEGEGTIHQA